MALRAHPSEAGVVTRYAASVHIRDLGEKSSLYEFVAY